MSIKGNRIGALIPVRMSSSRLPRKPLCDVAGMTALERVAARARSCRRVDRLVIATTSESSDDELARFASTRGFDVFRGSVQDVLRRMAEAARAFELDIIVEIDGDDLLCATEYMDRGLDLIEEQQADLVQFEGLPIGATPNILRTSALERAVALKNYEDTATGFFRFLHESGAFKIVKSRVTDLRHQDSELRMTLDYKQDLDFFAAIYHELDKLGPTWSFDDLMELARRRRDLVALNQGLDAAYKAHFDAGVHR